MFALCQPSFLIKLIAIEALYHVLSTILKGTGIKRLRLKVEFSATVHGALLHYLVFMLLEAVLTVYIAALAYAFQRGYERRFLVLYASSTECSRLRRYQ